MTRLFLNAAPLMSARGSHLGACVRRVVALAALLSFSWGNVESLFAQTPQDEPTSERLEWVEESSAESAPASSTPTDQGDSCPPSCTCTCACSCPRPGILPLEVPVATPAEKVASLPFAQPVFRLVTISYEPRVPPPLA